MPDIIDTSVQAFPTNPSEQARSFSGGILAAIREGFYASPTSALARSIEMAGATAGTYGLSGVGYSEDQYDTYEFSIAMAQEHGAWASRETAERQLSENGLSASDVKLSPYGANQYALSLAMDTAKQRNERSAAMAGAGTIGSFGGQLLGSAADPIGLAASFIPVAGQARFAGSAITAGQKVGRAMKLARIGAIDGVAGAALTEPIVAWQMNAEGQDYTSNEFAANLLFGGLVGSGLHAGLGALSGRISRGDSAYWSAASTKPVGVMSDLVSQMPYEVRAAAMSKAISDGIYGRSVDVESTYGMSMTDYRKGSAFSVEFDRILTENDGVVTRANLIDIMRDVDPAVLPNKLRKLLSRDLTLEQASQSITQYVKQHIAPLRQARESLFPLYKGEKPQYLGDWLREAGGIDADAVARIGGKIDIEKAGLELPDGMTLKEAKKAAAKAGYFDGNRSVSDKKFIAALRNDIDGLGYARIADQNKLAKFEEFIAEVDSSIAAATPLSKQYAPLGSSRSLFAEAAAHDGSANLLDGPMRMAGEDQQLMDIKQIDSPQTMRGYDAESMQRLDELAEVKFDTASVTKRAEDDLQELMDMTESLPPEIGRALTAEAKAIDEAADKSILAHEKAVDCLLKASA